jgi:ankyrin repeat protein
VIELLLDQEGFECDPINRSEGDTPLHSAIRWINSEPAEQREFGNYLVNLMLEAGSDPTVRNRAKLTAYQLADPANPELRDLIRRHEELNQQEAAQAAYIRQNADDFIHTGDAKGADGLMDEEDDDAEFSGSDDEERAEFERRKAERKARR